MKRLLLAPLFLTLLLSSCKGQQIGEEQYISELDLAIKQMDLIQNMVLEKLLSMRMLRMS